MATWDPIAEEEYYHHQIYKQQQMQVWHFQTCMTCTPGKFICMHGFEIQQTLDILEEDLRKVQLKNKFY